MKKILIVVHLLISLVLSMNNAFSQCNIHLYQCSKCGQNSEGIKYPDRGKFCSGQSDPTRGHAWRDAGLTSFCQSENEKNRIRIEAECEKNKVKIFKGAQVIEWYCPNGKPWKIKYTNGIIEEYSEDASLLSRSTPKDGGNITEYYENGDVYAKGWMNANNEKDGEWYYKSYSSFSGNVSCNNCKVVFSNGDFLGIGSEQEVNQRLQNQLAEENEQKEYKQCSSIEEYQNFIKKYPESKLNPNAKKEISKIQAMDIFLAKPNLLNLLNYDQFSGDTYGSSLKEIDQALNDMIDGEYYFAFPFHPALRNSSYLNEVLNVADSLLKRHGISSIMKYFEYQDVQAISISINKEKHLIKAFNQRWTLRYYQGDIYTTITGNLNSNQSKIIVLKNGEEICECQSNNISDFLEQTIHDRRISRYMLNKDLMCGLRSQLITGMENSLENSTAYLLWFNSITDKQYQEFIIMRYEYFVNVNPTAFNQLTLAYLYWSIGNEEEALAHFKLAKSGRLEYTINKQVISSDLNTFIKEVHKGYIVNTWMIVLPNEKEFVKKIKAL